MKNLTIIGITPFEKPDINLIPTLYQAGAFPVLSLGNELSAAQTLLNQLNETDIPAYGVYLSNEKLSSIQIPEKAELIILPFGISLNSNKPCQNLSGQQYRRCQIS
ncbi:hypothetical protein ACFOEQ_01140 [Chryseobacterium arachidis]|uniref:hypothetical protein n=1 Tax=Chryseobacterium arachidis TaxID=1416778 RepID=UPI003622C7C3